MAKHASAYIGPDDWLSVKIPAGRYCNNIEILGFQAKVNPGAALHPAALTDVFEKQLQKTYAKWAESIPGIRILRRHVKMPYWSADEPRVPDNYRFVEAPESLATTSVSIIMVPNEAKREPSMGFYFNGDQLPSLRERIEEERKKDIWFQGLIGNLGYFMPRGLFDRGADTHPWSHNNRYPKYQLPEINSYIGFYWFVEDGEVFSSFEGAHPAVVGIRKDRRVEIHPRMKIQSYQVNIKGQSFKVTSINALTNTDKVMLFTPGLRGTPEIEGHVKDWIYPYRLPLIDKDRVNIFIANEGNGRFPVERVIKIWEGPAPLPSFGAVLSFEKAYFESCFGQTDSSKLEGQRVRVTPNFMNDGGTQFDIYEQILGGFIPVVVEGKHIYCVSTVDEVVENLEKYGNANSPVAECGRESRNFDPYIREPAGVLIQTSRRIGWVLFDGRHALSIGASVVDAAQILKMLEDDLRVREVALNGERIRNAVLIDGGSAMKVYAVKSDHAGLTLDLLNRVAPGSRNGSGADSDGLNLYTSLRLGF